MSSLFHKIFGFVPDNIPVEYSNKGLWLFQGGCFWEDEDSPKIQLRKSLKTKKRLLGIYSKDELIAHELVHAVRRYFDEPMFEEVLAYQTATSSFRRYFGPLFQNEKEVCVWLTAVCLPIISFYFPAFFPLFFGGMALLSTFFLARLVWKQKTYKKCLKNLSALLKNKQKARGFALKLTDQEIILFCKMAHEEVLTFAEKRQEYSSRWKALSKDFLADG